MRSLFLLPLAALILMQTGCGVRPLPLQAAPTLRQPVMTVAPMPQGFRTSMSGLLGEEVELSGIYSLSPSGAALLLRSGEQIALTDALGRIRPQLAGLEHRSTVRIRGRLRALQGTAMQGNLGLEVLQLLRI